MQLGIFAKTFVRPTLEETLDAVVDHGLRHVQFNMSCAGLPTLPERIDESLCRWIAQSLRARGVTMAAISGTFNLVRSRRGAIARQPSAARYSRRGMPLAGYPDHHTLHRDARSLQTCGNGIQKTCGEAPGRFWSSQ